MYGAPYIALGTTIASGNTRLQAAPGHKALEVSNSRVRRELGTKKSAHTGTKAASRVLRWPRISGDNVEVMEVMEPHAQWHRKRPPRRRPTRAPPLHFGMPRTHIGWCQIWRIRHAACKPSLSTLMKRQPLWTVVISKQHYCRSQVGDYAFLRHWRNTSKTGKWE